MVPAAGVEPATFRSVGERSNPLSYAGNTGLREKIAQQRVVFYFGHLAGSGTVGGSLMTGIDLQKPQVVVYQR